MVRKANWLNTVSVCLKGLRLGVPFRFPLLLFARNLTLN